MSRSTYNNLIQEPIYLMEKMILSFLHIMICDSIKNKSNWLS